MYHSGHVAWPRSAARHTHFPLFQTRAGADEAHRRIRAVTTYMRVMQIPRQAERRAKKRRAAAQLAVAAEAKRVAGERRARELEERRAAEREARADRTEGPAARTRAENTRTEGEQASRGIGKQRGLTAKRWGATHGCARVGHIVVRMLEETVHRERRGDG